ncbi:PEP-CTERM sorting domain-containing protein [Sphingomonas sp. AP4-R1]|nr:PEP-CTERM sorting domain-containing protein [Sphingomonas sp. AP4-R1]
MTIDSPFLPDASSPWAAGFANGPVYASAGISHSVFGHGFISSDFMIYQSIHIDDPNTGLTYNYLMVIDMCCDSAVPDPLMPVTPDLLVAYLNREVGRRTDQLLASWSVRDRDQNLIAGESAGDFATLTAVERLVAAPVPEPASWALFIGGFGMIGMAMRRHRRTGFSRA